MNKIKGVLMKIEIASLVKSKLFGFISFLKNINFYLGGIK
jgi:hypothetical protein